MIYIKYIFDLKDWMANWNSIIDCLCLVYHWLTLIVNGQNTVSSTYWLVGWLVGWMKQNQMDVVLPHSLLLILVCYWACRIRNNSNQSVCLPFPQQLLGKTPDNRLFFLPLEASAAELYKFIPIFSCIVTLLVETLPKLNVKLNISKPNYAQYKRRIP